MFTRLVGLLHWFLWYYIRNHPLSMFARFRIVFRSDCMLLYDLNQLTATSMKKNTLMTFFCLSPCFVYLTFRVCVCEWSAVSIFFLHILFWFWWFSSCLRSTLRVPTHPYPRCAVVCAIERLLLSTGARMTLNADVGNAGRPDWGSAQMTLDNLDSTILK